MDRIDEVVLTAMSMAGFVPSSESERELLERLVGESYVYRQEREPTLPGDPTPPPIYVLTVRGRAYVENLKRGRTPKGD